MKLSWEKNRTGLRLLQCTDFIQVYLSRRSFRRFWIEPHRTFRTRSATSTIFFGIIAVRTKDLNTTEIDGRLNNLLRSKDGHYTLFLFPEDNPEILHISTIIGEYRHFWSRIPRECFLSSLEKKVANLTSDCLFREYEPLPGFRVDFKHFQFSHAPLEWEKRARCYEIGSSRR